ncbi:MAG TPA: mechanosensitive ion channel family protein, partial [Bacillota bacterium]|nr:mechanosensitive ion channel family protein [Bacillota bacterium]
LTLAWGMWASAQPATNPPAATATNPVAPLVQHVERLQGEPLTFGLDRIPWLGEVRFLGEPLWKYVASLIYILLAFYVSKLIDLVTQVWLKGLASKTETKLDDLLLDLLHGPIKVVVFVTLLNIGLNVFEWSDKVRVYLSKSLILVVAGSLTYLAIKVVGLLLETWRLRNAQEVDRKFDDQLFSVLRRSLTAFIIIVAVLVTAQNIGVNITAAITSLSIGGLAVGLAAQDTLANLFGAVSVFADKPFRVGDQIKLDAGEGTVEDVGLRSTRVRNPEGSLVTIPNKTMGAAAIINLTRRTDIKTVMNLGLARTLPADKVKRALAILEEVYRGHPMTKDVWISFNQFAGANLNVLILHWWRGTDYQRYLAGMQEMNLAVKERFDAEGIGTA